MFSIAFTEAYYTLAFCVWSDNFCLKQQLTPHCLAGYEQRVISIQQLLNVSRGMKSHATTTTTTSTTTSTTSVTRQHHCINLSRLLDIDCRVLKNLLPCSLSQRTKCCVLWFTYMCIECIVFLEIIGQQFRFVFLELITNTLTKLRLKLDLKF